MHFSSPNAFYNAQTRKYIRFKFPHSSGNMTRQGNINNKHAANLNIKTGDTGLIYRVNGATIYIGFGENLKMAPDRHTSPASFAATIAFTIHDIDKVEVEV